MTTMNQMKQLKSLKQKIEGQMKEEVTIKIEDGKLQIHAAGMPPVSWHIGRKDDYFYGSMCAPAGRWETEEDVIEALKADGQAEMVFE